MKIENINLKKYYSHMLSQAIKRGIKAKKERNLKK